MLKLSEENLASLAQPDVPTTKLAYQLPWGARSAGNSKKLASAAEQVARWTKIAVGTSSPATPIGGGGPQPVKPKPSPVPTPAAQAPKKPVPPTTPKPAAPTAPAAPAQFDLKSAWQDLTSMGWEAALQKWGPSIVSMVSKGLPGAGGTQQATTPAAAPTAQQPQQAAAPSQGMYANAYVAPSVYNASQAARSIDPASRQTASAAMQGVA